jgi:hypothetical protein
MRELQQPGGCHAGRLLVHDELRAVDDALLTVLGLE